jgi:hypothetical protein
MSFHMEYRRCGERVPHVKPIYFFRYGFGVWVYRRIFSCGWDGRSGTWEKQP